MQTGKRKCVLLMAGIAVVALLAGSAAVAADRVVVIPLGGAKSYIVPDDNSACVAAKAGLMRFTGSVFEGCNGTKWVSLSPVPTVYSSGHEWMDRNLGASRVAISFNDTEAYGDLYQWGRFSDGHEKRNSSTTATLSGSDDPGHGDFIITNDILPNDWRSAINDDLWQAASGINNPCPVGFRLPTKIEWDAEIESWATNDSAGAYGSPLKLVVAGCRYPYSGRLLYMGSTGYYWSGSAGVGSSYGLLIFSSDTNTQISTRANGFSVRCLKD